MRHRLTVANRFALGLCRVSVWTSMVMSVAVAQAADVPLTKVVLFNSGVGYFEHLGEVDGEQQLELKFNVEQVNDLLKSLVLQDFGGGQVEAVGYGSKTPAARILRTFTIDLTREPTIADLLRQVRGEKVQLQAPTTITGKILGVEIRQVRINKDQAIEQEMLNLLTTTGLRSVPLDSVSEIRLLNEKLNAELEQALALLAGDHAGDDKKAVKIQFSGQGKRPVRVGYIQESPIWKTSYRLVLDDEKPPFLQGWAIVENTTEHDWHDVALTLVSGRPISFVMDLYQPLYLDRPLVVPELFASLRPRTYDQDLAAREQQFRDAAQNRLPQRRGGISGFGSLGGGMGGGMGMGGGGIGGFGGGGSFGGPARPAAPVRRLDLAQGVQSAATAADLGELFRYTISHAVSIPRQQSSMLPIVNEPIAAEKFSIYNPEVDSKHPLNGLRLTNATKLHLMQGPITVFDAGEYAGDAQIEDIAPGAKRLLSYAVDLDVEVAAENRLSSEELVSVRIARGTLSTTRKLQRTQRYVLRNSGSSLKKLLIEYPRDSAWKLVAPERPTEQTRQLYRFQVDAKPGRPEKFAIEEEQRVHADFAVTSLGDDALVLYFKAHVASPALKQALSQLIELKNALAELSGKKSLVVAEIGTIGTEQDRIRKNMEQLDRHSSLYDRYVKKFAEQEDRMEVLRADSARLSEQETAQQKKINDFIAALDVE